MTASTTPASANLRLTIAVAAATAAAVLLATWAVSALSADAASSSDDSTFVAITPCRLFDTRPATNVGPRDTAIGADEAHTIQVTGSNGDCSIPTTASAVAINLTGARATTTTYVAVYPADADNPGTSALNLAPGQAATPNTIDVKLSVDGRLIIYNRFGTVHLVGDVVGYYRTDAIAELTQRLDALEADNAELRHRLANVSLETVDDQPTLRFTDVNVQIVDGTGDTSGETNGRGNLIVGYNEQSLAGSPAPRTGSHNLVLGKGHGYSSYSGAVFGTNNRITNIYASVLGGYGNEASGSLSTVVAGTQNEAARQGSAILAGSHNVASGLHSAVVAGFDNAVEGGYSSILGGTEQTLTQSAAHIP